MLIYKDKVFNVLQIEDNPADARLAVESLKEAKGVKFNLYNTATLSAGIDAISRQHFDIVLLDLSLPDSMGLDTFSKLHQYAPHLPIIVGTGLDDEDMAIRAVREGAQDYIVKGVEDPRQLVRTILYAIERKGLEDRLIQSEKMDAIGQMAEGIAHDFNNILSVIKTNAELIRLDIKERGSIGNNPAIVLDSAERVIAATDKAVNIVHGLYALGKKQPIHQKIADLNDIIKKFERFLRMLTGKNNIQIFLKLTDQHMHVMADSTQIEQVLMNLAINARDAMPDGGILSIETDFLDSSRVTKDELSLFEGGRFAVLSVSDTGHGIEQKVIDRIFEPFFTTKEEGKGTGLGLSMVYRIIKQHNGHLRCHSEPGKGTTFKIYLPMAAPEV